MELLISFESEAFATVVFIACLAWLSVVTIYLLKIIEKFLYSLYIRLLKKNNKKQEKQKLKTVQDYLTETSFTFDPEDDKRLISKTNSRLAIRIHSNGHNKDEVTIGFNLASRFYNNEVDRIKKIVLEIEKVFFDHGTHEITIEKGSGAKWQDIGQRLIETVFNIYEEKYSVEE